MSSDPNPYASPDPSAQGPGSSTGTNQPAGPPFASGHQRAILVMGMLAIGMVMNLIGTGSGYMELGLLKRFQAGQEVTDLEADQNDQRQMLVGVLQMVAYIVTAILFLMWFHRAHRNLRSLGARGLKYSPGWAVGGFFVPFLNLVRPYQVMQEVQKGSDPSGLDGGASSGSALIGLWWGCWIITNIAAQASFRFANSAEQIPQLILASYVTLAADVISIPAAILAILVIRGIDTDQETRHERISPNSSMATPRF